MRTRHRIPSLFNLSMVDVLCCALGCVVLLWLLNLRDAKDRAAAAEVASAQLATTKTDLGGLGQSVRDLEATNARLTKEAAAHAKELADAGRKVNELQGDKQALLDQVKRTRAAADARFAGISLTGRRVVFLVDMSGSMELIDERTPSAGKWQGVRETLAKLMKSLPELEKYQVILFSDRVSYPLGNETGWLAYDAMSADRTLNALAAVRPVGNTNMYAAFEAAFRLRADGLDTIYLLSDGLPSIGDGMTMEQARQLKE